MKATIRLAQNAIQLPAVLGTEVDVGETAVLGECEVGGVCVGEATRLGADGFWLWERLALVSKRLIKKALEAKTRL